MRKGLLALLIISALALSACTGGEQQGPQITPYIGGFDGLKVSFAGQMPPPQVFDASQQPFSVGVTLENIGESAVGVDTLNQYGYVQLTGISPENYGKSPEELRIYFDEWGLQLDKVNRVEGAVVTGGVDIVTFDNLNYLLDRVGPTEEVIRANVCYEYRSYANAEICIKDQVLELASDDPICTLTGAKVVTGSGAPVQVTAVTQNPAGQHAFQVSFQISNVGSGVVYAPYPWQTSAQTAYGDDACRQVTGFNPNRDRVHVQVSIGQPGVYSIDCPTLGGGDRGIVPMFGGTPATVVCRIETDPNGQRVFKDSLNVDLWYTYLEWIDQPLLVQDAQLGFNERGSISGIGQEPVLN